MQDVKLQAEGGSRRAGDVPAEDNILTTFYNVFPSI